MRIPNGEGNTVRPQRPCRGLVHSGAWQVFGGLEDLVNGVHQGASDYFPAVGATLYCDDEVVNKDVGIGKLKAGRFHSCFVMSHGRQPTPNNNRC